MATPHSSLASPYRARASLPSTGSLASYLLRLISIKQTNLCLSADVETSAELLALAEEVGDSICMLKTHCDIVIDWTDRTAQALKEIARRKYFVVFEDRKFADIGETVQKQYTSGHHRITAWAEITNAHILPGPAIEDDDEDTNDEVAVESPNELQDEERRLSIKANDRKHSVVSISTTISTRTESISPRPDADFPRDEPLNFDKPALLARLGQAPFLRSLLLLAEMSSDGHLLTPEYSEKCVEIARNHREFVMGFIAQRSLNTQPEDNFIVMTPGCQLPPPGQEGKKLGDGLGQQYNTPRKLILEQGCDIIIVGRGIVRARDRKAEAERYMAEGWKAYLERVGELLG